MDDFAKDFHPTFQKELSKQLFEKGELVTGIKNFNNYNFQLIVGIINPRPTLIGTRIEAIIEFITPDAFAFPVIIYWTTFDLAELPEIHKKDISKTSVEINWMENFPLQEVLAHLPKKSPLS